MNFNKVEGISEEDIDYEFYKVDEIVEVNYAFKDVFVCIEDQLVRLHLLFVLKIDLLGVVMKTDLRGSLEKSHTFLALHQQTAKLCVKKFVELVFCVVFLEV